MYQVNIIALLRLRNNYIQLLEMIYQNCMGIG